jgi:hypothetical protein
MNRCIGITKKGTQCTRSTYIGYHQHRCCGIHNAQGFVTRPDITEAPAEVPSRKAKLDPYYVTGCRVFQCEHETVFGELVCEHHYRSKLWVYEGIDNEKRRFTPYYQNLLHQNLNNPNRLNADFQARINVDKNRRQIIDNAWVNNNSRNLNPFYIIQCQQPGCTTPNRFGRFTCLAHKPMEETTKIMLTDDARLKTMRYQMLKYAEMMDPRRNNADFQEQIRQTLANREARRQERIAAQPNQLNGINQAVNRLNQVVANIVQPQREDAEGRWVFERDPEGGVNLQALANDRQSVHRSSVQEETLKNIQEILKVPLVEPMLPECWDSHYVEFLTEIDDAKLFNAAQYENIRYVFGYEASQQVASFNVRFVDLFGHVWSYIKPHKDRVEMMRRLGEELMESRGMCSNGKIARLVNALQGFMEGLSSPVDKMEVFAERFAKLMELPKMKRVASALELFKEFEIPDDKQEEWFMPLVEA